MIPAVPPTRRDDRHPGPTRPDLSLGDSAPAAGAALALLLPEGVAQAEEFGPPAPAPLTPQEEAVIARAVTKRRQEFAAVRGCARRALADIGVPYRPLLPGDRGAPGWPAGVVGSMTHCDGYRAAVVAHAADFLALGLDAEPHAALPDRVSDLVLTPVERSRRDTAALAWPQLAWDRLIFSTKESVYKTWFPLTGRWLDFHDAEVDVMVAAKGTGWEGTFRADLAVPGVRVGGSVINTFRGRWCVRAGIVLTTIVLRHPDGSGNGSGQHPEGTG